MVREETQEVNVLFHVKEENGSTKVLPADKGRILTPGYVLAYGEGSEVDIYAYDRRDGDTVEIWNDNHALFSFNYLVGNEETHDRITAMIKEGVSVVDWLRCAVQLNSEAHEGGTY
ncbi:hypothetical protein J0K78_17070 [Halobacillus sp. GSS1]|uniref:hypothetical protein n=1 Tax=Halobacillus sp. GSS1 TaxID=2815919 RepID=UPI001A8DDB58|nr:hypothetical protein [Halobacillus sp. GSS1]MBN9655990.1 hypothetical protein [Halobacillus sp. GSS1]